MSKPIKKLIIENYRSRFGELEGALIVDIRGIDANDNNEMRKGLLDKQIRVTVVKNNLARKAFDDTALSALLPVLDGPIALAYGSDSVVEVARAVVEWARKVKELDLKGAVLEGELYEGAEGVRRLSQFPTRDEAKAAVVQLVLTPGGNIVGAALNGGGKLMAVVKELQERLEKGETIAKIA
jgi:large subunit ribosomal protein L10